MEWRLLFEVLGGVILGVLAIENALLRRLIRDYEEALHRLASGKENGEYTPLSGSPWRPASEPPKQTEWVIAWADGAVRCVAWNSDKRCWEDWDGHGALNLDGIEWWMSIPDAPANEQVRRDSAAPGGTDGQN